ncbi:hypothetical protein MKZ38_005955 [Zalerion maritima]|uniref:Uncharacterized protein n=1 Tax=Zalerion maritima TaxID=339359 RepID=A0AAD5WUN0_9PEZI|nr:hypothetical protein MKZ38_005955 [Zalerion maritima]
MSSFDVSPYYIPPCARQGSGNSFSTVSFGSSDNSTSTSMSGSESFFSMDSNGTHLTTPSHPSFAGIDGGFQARTNRVLPCEFGMYSLCNRYFEDEDEWVIHHIKDHLKDKLPRTLRCPMCDDWVFSGPDKERSFWDRMRHWAGHYDPMEQMGPLRIDHFMAQHLVRRGMVSQQVMEVSEMSPEIYEPIAEGARPIGWQTPRAKKQSNIRDRVPVDQAAEDRRRRRQRT